MPPDPIPDFPKDDPPDVNEGRELSDAYRTARRNLVAICGFSWVWACLQFTTDNPVVSFAGITIELSGLAWPPVLCFTLIYLGYRWGMEFAMMPRHMRRWPLAQLDFRIISNLTRVSLLAIASGMVERSPYTLLKVLVALGGVGCVFLILTFCFMPLTMFVRMKARQRVGRESAANAALEAFAWAMFFSLFLVVLGVIILGAVAHFIPGDQWLPWLKPVHSLAGGWFLLTLAALFITHFPFQVLKAALFAVRPNYYTEVRDEGHRRMYFRGPEPKEPLL